MEDLNAIQVEHVHSYLAITGLSDVNVAIASLERFNFDLEKAVLAYLDESASGSSSQQTTSPPPEQPATTLASMLTWPLRFIWDLLIRVLSLPGYYFSSYRAISSDDRRDIPSQTSHNFKEQFEKQYGHVHPTFLELNYSQALEKAKQEIKFLVVYLHSDEHESADEFCGNTLASQELVSFFNEHDLLFWGGNVGNTEGYQVSLALQSSGFPFLALISLRPRSTEAGGYKASVIERIEGIATPEEITRKLWLHISRINPQLNSLRQERVEQEAARSLREQQDHAYQRSLLADQEKARRIKEQQEAEARERDQQARELERNALNAKYRTLYVASLSSKLPSEPGPEEPGTSRFSIRLANGERVIRRFRGSETVKDLYHFVETIIPADPWAPSTPTSEAVVSLPPHYEHKFGFRLTSYPRLVFEPTSEPLKEVANLWPGASLLVEPVGI